jgi:protein-disulfide isomerase
MSRSDRRARARRQSKGDHREERQRRTVRRRRFSLVQLAATSLVAVLAVIALVWLGSLTTQPPATALPTATAPPTAIGQSGHARGQADAPVTIEEWGDFQCPACGEFARLTEPQLLATYIAKGQVAIVFHHMAFLGQESSWAAEAAECAGELGKFFEYHDKLFASQAGENRGAFSKENLKRFGTEIGLGPSFAACVDSGRYTQVVRDDTKLGQDRGVTATPTLFIGGRKIEGAPSFEGLKTMIDPLLVGR